MELSGTQAFLAVIVALFGGGAFGAIVVKYLNRGVDDATAEKLRADVKEAAQRTAASEVDTLREIIAEVRASEAQKTARIDSLEQRLEKLEERERHALTRAAVHESWDALAFQFILQHDSSFTPPPPLGPRRLPGSRDEEF